MNENETTVIYEYAAALMPSEGKWNKPDTVASVLAHVHALRNVPFELGCHAVTIVMTRDGKWPAPWLLLKAAKELSSDLDLERAMWAHRDEIEESVDAILEIAQHVLLDNETMVESLLATTKAARELSK